MAKYSVGMQEEELKNKVREDWFSAYDNTRIIGKVDFCVAIPATELNLFEAENALWAEAKAGVKKDIHESFVQLILIIGRARTFNDERPPIFLGAFDAEKIAFLPYTAVMDVFEQNDFNWNVAPSNHETKEFAQLHELAEKTIAAKSLLFDFEKDEKELKKFIKDNFKTGRKDVSRIQIDKNNFTHIYRKWREAVLPHIDAPWDVLKKKYSLYDRDFYLAELNVDDNGTADISDDTVASDFYITFNAQGKNRYRIQRKNADELSIELTFGFKSEAGVAAYAAFWSRYKRPPRKDYWNYIVKRLDLLVPQDVRELKGAFFTPQKWVELSQVYLAKELGENWQDDYFIWDCCAGTGNMEAGLTNKYNVWASTLDQQDVDVMRERVKNGANLLDGHIFQFDFLNDFFDKLPDGLKEIVNDPEKRKKLVIYINPPYAEGDNRVGRGRKISQENHVTKNYGSKMGYGKRELFVQFVTRINEELRGCVIGEFSTPKILQAPAFGEVRSNFRPMLSRMFMVPANTFDNVKGQFPIGFKVWRTDLARKDDNWPVADVYDGDGVFVGEKTLVCYDGKKLINDWVETFGDNKHRTDSHGTLIAIANDFENQGTIRICEPNRPWNHQFQWQITPENLIHSCAYMTVRTLFPHNYTNHYDQFLFPDDAWLNDKEFQGDCLVNILFHPKNRVSSDDGANQWIPFVEGEVDANDRYASHFMSDFLAGKVKMESGDLFGSNGQKGIVLSDAAKEVLDAGRELWRYYHKQPGANPNASYYDIRKHFQGMKTTASGKEQMNATSGDADYNERLAALKQAMKALAAKIAPKVYEYGFLRK